MYFTGFNYYFFSIGGFIRDPNKCLPSLLSYGRSSMGRVLAYVTPPKILEDWNHCRHRLPWSYDMWCLGLEFMSLGFLCCARNLLPFLDVSVLITSTPSLPGAPLVCLMAGLSIGLVTPLKVHLYSMLFSDSAWQYAIQSWTRRICRRDCFGNIYFLKVFTNISIAGS